MSSRHPPTQCAAFDKATRHWSRTKLAYALDLYTHEASPLRGDLKALRDLSITALTNLWVAHVLPWRQRRAVAHQRRQRSLKV